MVSGCGCGFLSCFLEPVVFLLAHRSSDAVTLGPRSGTARGEGWATAMTVSTLGALNLKCFKCSGGGWAVSLWPETVSG